MNFLPANELEEMTLKELIAYKSLLIEISQTKDFPEIDKKIIDRISDNINGYKVDYHRELSTAMVPWENKKKFLDGYLSSLTQAREEQELTEKKEAETSQKQALIGELIPVYIEMTYPLAEVISILGKTTLKIATKEELVKAGGMDKASISALVNVNNEKAQEGKRDKNIELTH